MDYNQLIKDKKEELGDLTTRMDEDRKLTELAAYVLRDVDKKKVPHAISITLNDPLVFATNVESALGASTEQIVVESDDNSVDTAYIEDVLRAAFAQANEYQLVQGSWGLNPFLDQQMCRRGRAYARCLFSKEKDEEELIPKITGWDSRYTYYEPGVWVAYETTRSKAQLLRQYPDAKVTKKSGVVLDIWDLEHNEVLLDDRKIFEQPNPYKFLPVCEQIVPIGSMMADKDSFRFQGESIFLMIRDLVPELNRLVSIIQSLNMKALDNAMLWKSTAGQAGESPEHDALTSPTAVILADIGGGAEPVAYGELRQSAWLLHSMIETRIQRGSLSNLDLGIMGNQPWSAVALIEIGEGRDQVFAPRLGARGLLKQRLANILIEQIKLSGESTIRLGAMGHKQTYKVGKLDGEYDITFKYFIKSPKIDIARYSIAAAAGDLIPDRVKRRDILQREDPDEDERWLRWEEVERLSPALKIDRIIRNLVEMAERGDENARYEAELLSAEMGMTLEQMLSGGAAQIPTPEKGQKPQPLVPLTGRGTQTSAKTAAQLQQKPRGEEGE